MFNFMNKPTLTPLFGILSTLLFSMIIALFVMKPLIAETRSVSTEDAKQDEAIRALLKQVAEKSILPTYQQFAKTTETQVKQAEALCKDSNDENITAMKQAWSNALSAWQRADALLFGPAIDEQLDFAIYFLPAKKTIIKGVLKSETPITIEHLENAGVGAQGFGALEYLLFDRDHSISFSGEKGKQRCHYVLAASQLINQHANEILSAWQNGYAEAFYTAGKGSAEFTEAEQPLEILINKLFQTVEKVSNKKLGIPLDKKNNGEHVNAYKLEAWRSGHTLPNIQANLQGLQSLIIEGGITHYLQQHEQIELAEALEKQFDLLSDYKFESDDLFTLLNANKGTADDYYNQVKTLTHLIKRELAPALNIQLGFNDNDGD